MGQNEEYKGKKGEKRKMSGWLIALIVVVVVFAAGAICCNTIGKDKGKENSAAPAVSVSQKADSR